MKSLRVYSTINFIYYLKLVFKLQKIEGLSISKISLLKVFDTFLKKTILNIHKYYLKKQYCSNCRQSFKNSTLILGSENGSIELSKI